MIKSLSLLPPALHTFVTLSVSVLLVIPSVALPEESSYPASDVITGVEFDMSTLRNTAPGNGARAFGSDNWAITWASDGHQYVSWGDGEGFQGDGISLVGFGFARIEGGKDNYSAFDVWYGAEKQSTGNGGVEPAGKCRGLISVNGTLYFWKEGMDGRLNGSGSDSFLQLELWKVTDLSTFNAEPTSVKWDIADDPNWPTEGFFAGTFLQFGQDNQGARDSFVYSYVNENSGDGWEVQSPGGISLLRVPADSMETKTAYEFFAGLDSNGNPTWTSDIAARAPVFQDAANGNMRTSVSYNAPLSRYLLTTQQVSRFMANNAHIGIYEAPEPWGPWRTVLFDTPANAGPNLNVNSKTVYWNFSNKWLSQDGSDFVMVYTGAGEDEFGTVEGRFVTNLDPNQKTPKQPEGLMVQ